MLRGPLAGPGRLWAAISPEGVWRVLAASGEARWARTWSGIGLLHSRQRSGSPQAQSLELGALGPFPPLLSSHAPFGTPAKKLFLAFFLPSSPILETTTPPDVTTFQGRVTWPQALFYNPSPLWPPPVKRRPSSSGAKLQGGLQAALRGSGPAILSDPCPSLARGSLSAQALNASVSTPSRFSPFPPGCHSPTHQQCSTSP